MVQIRMFNAVLVVLGYLVVGLFGRVVPRGEGLWAVATSLALPLSQQDATPEAYLPFVPVERDAVTYHVSRTGNNADGKSWVTAWNELDQVDWDGIQPGDVILLDGGATECAFPVEVTGDSNAPRRASGGHCGMVYESTLTLGKSGEPDNPITIQLAQEPGKDGTVRIFGGRTNPLPHCGQTEYEWQDEGARSVGIFSSGGSDVVFDGRKWNGIMIYGHNGHGMEIDRSSSRLTVRNVEIYDNGVAYEGENGWYPDLPGVDLEGTNITFEHAIIHDNGQDAFQSGGGLSEFTLRDSWLYVGRQNPAESESFNYCRHPDGMQVFDGGAQHGFLFENIIFGPGFMQGVILGQATPGQEARIHDVTFRDVLFTKAGSTNIMGYPGVKSQGWTLDHVTSHCPSPCNHVIFLEGDDHTIRDSIFHSGNIHLPDGLDSYSGNCQWNTDGFQLGQVVDPLFVDVHDDDLFSLDDYSLALDSPCAGKGSSVTSVAQLLMQGTPTLSGTSIRLPEYAWKSEAWTPVFGEASRNVVADRPARTRLDPAPSAVRGETGAQQSTPGTDDLGAAVSPTTDAAAISPVTADSGESEDWDDVLLLHDSRNTTGSDVNFCKLAEYYGLGCSRIAVDSIELTDELLRDGRGEYFKLIAMSADPILKDSSLISRQEMDLIYAAVEREGINLLVMNVRDGTLSQRLTEMTDGAIVGAIKPQAPTTAWSVSTAAPEIAREFTGQHVVYPTSDVQADSALILGSSGSTTPLIDAEDGMGASYPVFVRCERGAGSIFFDAAGVDLRLDWSPLWWAYFYPDHRYFSQLVPLMMTIRYAMGDEVWHNDQNYANLVIDDPTLTEPFGRLSFLDLLEEMKTHSFHTTIAFIPVNLDTSQPLVEALFKDNPDWYSMVVHGNNHDGYEFYKYMASDADDYPARPLRDQQLDIIEGITRMERHRQRTGVPYDRVMVFPYGISPEPTLVLLKRYDFLGTINQQDMPLDTTRPDNSAYKLYPAIMDYGNFPVLTRMHPGSYEPFTPDILPFVFNLFIDKPAFFYSHEGQLFAEGIDAFSPVADRINALPGNVVWRSPGDIMRHLYLEKESDDGDIEVRMYSNEVVVTNESSRDRVYHISKEENLNVPILALTVNDDSFPYRVEDGLLKLDAIVPAGHSMEIVIRYAGQALRAARGTG